MPKYYEPINETNEKPTESTNEMDCFQDCVNNDTCVQYVFYNSNCYLKKKFNLTASIPPSYKNATVRSIRSNFIFVIYFIIFC